MLATKGSNVCEIVTGDCVELMRALPDSCVTCCVTSPPYDRLRTYGNIKPFTWLVFMDVAVQLWRVMAPGGVIAWVVGDSVVDGSETTTSAEQKIFFRALGFVILDSMVYEKLNPGNPSDKQGRYNQTWENVFVLSKSKPATWNPLRDKPNVSHGKVRFGNKILKKADGSVSHEFPRKPAAEFGLRGNVWLGPTAAQERPCQPIAHPAAMPEWLARDLLLSWSNPGDTVFDPFAGRGTVGKMALAQGRNALLFEINLQYADAIEGYLG